MKLSRPRFFFIALTGVFFSVSLPAYADYEYQFSQKISPYLQYESEMAGKISRGITNLAFGWTEFMSTPARMADEPDKGFMESTVIGIPWGAMRAIGRTLVGAYETVTFLAPQKPILEPIAGDDIL